MSSNNFIGIYKFCIILTLPIIVIPPCRSDSQFSSIMNGDELKISTTPDLIGRRIYLRPAIPDDYLITYAWFLKCGPSSQTCRPVTLTTPEEMAARQRSKEKTTDRSDFVMVSKKTHQLVGKLAFFNLNLLNRSAELGYIVAPESQRQGFAREGLILLISYLFRQLNLNKVYAQTGSFNTASVSLLESLGFKRDAVLRRHHFHNGEFHDDYIYSLLKTECNF